jgi:hypothetical protein
VDDPPKAGTKLQDEATGVQAIVVKPPKASGLELRAGGEAVVLGKRYTCASCGSEVLVTRVGAGHVVCHDAPMAMAQTKQLPSSD